MQPITANFRMLGLVGHCLGIVPPSLKSTGIQTAADSKMDPVLIHTRAVPDWSQIESGDCSFLRGYMMMMMMMECAGEGVGE